jgi:uncharacterized protein YjbI with pentapeptide repeats
MARRALAERWEQQGGKELVSAVLTRLRLGKSLSGLGLAEYEARIDLRGIVISRPEATRTYEAAGFIVQDYSKLTEFRGVQLENLDFSGGPLESLRFFNVKIDNCRFDGANCRDWRGWGVRVRDTSFESADLRDSLLGGVDEGRSCAYQNVSFRGSKLRGIVCDSASFVDCDFTNAALPKVEFCGCRFVRCRFRGLLREVMFCPDSLRRKKVNHDALEDVDFSEAELRFVDFRQLNLRRVRLPQDDEHLIVNRYRCVLERAVRELEQDTKFPAVNTDLEHRLYWVGPRQDVGVFNRLDFLEFGGTEEEADFAAALLQRLERECASAPPGRRERMGWKVRGRLKGKPWKKWLRTSRR